jgi:hypothetical protein
VATFVTFAILNFISFGINIIILLKLAIKRTKEKRENSKGNKNVLVSLYVINFRVCLLEY